MVMTNRTFVEMFDALASEVRLGIFKLLVKYGRAGLVAGEISAELNIPPTNLSFHLKALVQAKLIHATQEGRYQRYRADLDAMMTLVNFLVEECCTQEQEGDTLPCTSPKGC